MLVPLLQPEHQATARQQQNDGQPGEEQLPSHFVLFRVPEVLPADVTGLRCFLNRHPFVLIFIIIIIHVRSHVRIPSLIIIHLLDCVLAPGVEEGKEEPSESLLEGDFDMDEILADDGVEADNGGVGEG